jgi:NDP-sugar pyrophosphorylase family protein
MDRERITISIKGEILRKIDQRIDGVKMRNRSHAIELLVSESLGLSQLNTAIIMAGGKGAVRLIPLVENAIINLKKFGFTDISVAVGFLGDKIKQSVGNGEKFGVTINYIEGGEGTAGALLPLKNQIKKSFVVVNLQDDLAVNLKNLSDFHREHLGVATIATNDIKTRKGYYILEPEIFDYIPKGFSMLEEDIFPKLVNDGKLIFYPILN